MIGIILIITVVASVFLYTGLRVFTWMFPNWKDWLIFDDKNNKMVDDYEIDYINHLRSIKENEVIFPS